MAKIKQSKKTAKPEKVIDYSVIYEPVKNIRYIIYAAILLLTIGIPVYYISNMAQFLGTNSFPLDDPWIHLTFARNLAKYFSFSYYHNEMVTAGSTSPIYTFLLAAGYFVSQNEFILSWIFGILFFSISGFYFYKLSSFDFPKENLFAIGATLIFLLDKWMNFISVSGMETTMFIFILIATAYFYRKRNVIPFAVFLGLILWTRPDGVAFIAALILDYLILSKFSKNDKSEVLFTKYQLIKILIISGGLTLLYFALNLSLSGSLLPNTYNAKLTYYAPEFRSRAEFLKQEVWQYFTSGAYAYIMAGFIIGFIFTLKNIFKGKYNQNILYIIFILLLIFIYWYKLPYAHRFGRYMMPIIPFFILVATSGFREIALMAASFIKSKQAVIFILALASIVILFFSVNDIAESRKMYADECKYIYDRQVKAALWINEHSAETDIVATHDVGAIAFYTQRKIIDVAGLVTPELITKLNEKDYSKYMTNYLKEKNVKYLAFLREWYRVANQNPLFSTANKLPPEIMEVYEFIPDKTMILSGDMKSMLMYAENMIMQKQIKNALQVLIKGASIEPKASVIYFYLGAAYMTAGDNVNAEKNFLKALEIFPDYNDALVQTGFFYKNSGRKEEARKYFERYLKLYPDDKEVQDLYKSVLD